MLGADGDDDEILRTGDGHQHHAQHTIRTDGEGSHASHRHNATPHMPNHQDMSKKKMRKMLYDKKDTLKRKLADSQRHVKDSHKTDWLGMRHLKQVEEVKSKIYETQAKAKKAFEKDHKSQYEQVRDAIHAHQPIPKTGLRKTRIEYMHQLTIHLPELAAFARKVKDDVDKHGAYTKAAENMENPLPEPTGTDEYHATSALRWLFRAKFQLVEMLLKSLHDIPSASRTPAQKSFITESQDIDTLKTEILELKEKLYGDKKRRAKYELADSGDFPKGAGGHRH